MLLLALVSQVHRQPDYPDCLCRYAATAIVYNSFEPLLQRSKYIFNCLLSLLHTLLIDLYFHLAAGELFVYFVLNGGRDFLLDVFGFSFGNRVGILTKLLNVLSVVP